MNIGPKLHFPENLFSRIYTCQNVHLAEITFPRKLIFQNSRIYIWPKLHFPESLFSRIYTCQNVHFPENIFSRYYTCQNVHLAEITFPRKLTVFSRIYTCQNVHLPEITFPRKLFFRYYTHETEILLLIEFTSQKYIIMFVHFQKLLSCM